MIMSTGERVSMTGWLADTGHVPARSTTRHYPEWWDSFDRDRGTAVQRPEREGPSYWAVAPGTFVDPDSGLFHRTYRLRRSRGEAATGRGYAASVASSTNGVDFENIWPVPKEELDTALRAHVHAAGDTYMSIRRQRPARRRPAALLRVRPSGRRA